MGWNIHIKRAFKEYFLLNRFSSKERKFIKEITPVEVIRHIEKLSLKQREQLGMYGL
jgi:hypothetical protein